MEDGEIEDVKYSGNKRKRPDNATEKFGGSRSRLKPSKFRDDHGASIPVYSTNMSAVDGAHMAQG